VSSGKPGDDLTPAFLSIIAPAPMPGKASTRATAAVIEITLAGAVVRVVWAPMSRC
jgi:hypothetical protein